MEEEEKKLWIKIYKAAIIAGKPYPDLDAKAAVENFKDHFKK